MEVRPLQRNNTLHPRRDHGWEAAPTAECRGHGGWFGNIEDAFPTLSSGSLGQRNVATNKEIASRHPRHPIKLTVGSKGRRAKWADGRDQTSVLLLACASSRDTRCSIAPETAPVIGPRADGPGRAWTSGTEAASPRRRRSQACPTATTALNDLSALPNRPGSEVKEHGRNLNSRWRWDTVCRATGGAVARARAGVARRKVGRLGINTWRVCGGIHGVRSCHPCCRRARDPKHCRDGIKRAVAGIGMATY